MRILIAEDEGPKLAHLIDFVLKCPDCEFSTARSVRTAIDEIERLVPDLVLLDMSLPTFEVGPGEPGGRPRGSGGAEVLRFLQFLEIPCAVIIVTQYEAIQLGNTEVDLDHLRQDLESEHPGVFLGVVKYSAMNDEWHEPLRALIQRVRQ